MKLDYVLDIDSRSTWKINTPNALSRRLPFYINECGHYIANSNYYTEREGQGNYLLLYTLSGSGYLKYLNQEHILKPGQAVSIYCAYYQYYKTLSDYPWDFKWVHFNGTAATEYYTLLNENSLEIVDINNMSTFEKKLDELQLYTRINDISCSIKASQLLTDIFSEMVISKFNPDNPEFNQHRLEIEKVIKYIQDNYNKKITLDDMSKVACISKYHFVRIFKNHIGMSPYEFLIYFRINKSKELLKSTDILVNEIAPAVGFDDCNNFIRKFKEIVGYTPLQYKRYNS